MRRVVSVILFVIGGWFLLTEAVVAFFDAEPGTADNLAMIGIFAAISIVPLLLGAWASPGRRWRELGLTILIATGFAAFCGVSTIAVFLDPAFKQIVLQQPMPKIEFAPVIGAANALAIAALGWLLHRGGNRVDPGTSPG
jgi:hypothetical protein